jgi:hypothetical protein
MTFLSPLDLLTVPDNEQDVIRCLSRRPNLTIQEIEKFTKIPLEELERLLNRMVHTARLIRDEEDKFQVLYGNTGKPKQQRAGNGLLDSLFG